MSIMVFRKKARKAIVYDGATMENGVDWSSLSASGTTASIPTSAWKGEEYSRFLWIAVSLTSGVTYTSSYGSEDWGMKSIELYDASGTKVANSSFEEDPETYIPTYSPLIYECESTGDYYIKVLCSEAYSTDSAEFNPRPADQTRPAYQPWETSEGFNAGGLPVRHGSANEAGLRFDGAPVFGLIGLWSALKKALAKWWNSWNTVTWDSWKNELVQEGVTPGRNNESTAFNPVYYRGRQALLFGDGEDYLTFSNDTVCKTIAFSYARHPDKILSSGALFIRAPYLFIELRRALEVNIDGETQMFRSNRGSSWVLCANGEQRHHRCDATTCTINGTTISAEQGDTVDVSPQPQYENIYLGVNSDRFITLNGFTADSWFDYCPALTDIGDAKWHGMVITRDGAYIKVYYDGEKVIDLELSSADAYDDLGQNDKNIYVGGRYQHYLCGYIGADFKIYDRALFEGEAEYLSSLLAD